MNPTRTPKLPHLPELSDATIDRMEQTLLARIADERRTPAHGRRARSRARTWLTVSGVAAAFVAGVLVAPPLINATTLNMSSNDVAEGAPGFGIGESPATDGGPMVAPRPEMGDMTTEGIRAGEKGGSDVTAFGTAGGVVPLAAPPDGREVIANANATVRVKEIAAASDAIAKIAGDLHGWVESRNVGEVSRSSDIGGMPVPPGGDWGWMSIRVPSENLDQAMTRLSEVGEVRSSSLSQQDVTSTAIDLRARVDATRASVERLTELMKQTGSVSELIEAEIALSDRQALLESYEQQLSWLEQQVAMSSLYVELQRIVPVTQADPAGFTDGLRSGWDGMMVSLNALVIAAGFILPWVVVLGLAGLVVWLILRARRRAGSRATEKSA